MAEYTRFIQNHLHYSFSRELTELYVSSTIRNIAVGLVLIFEPIYLYQVFGESLAKTFFFFGVTSLLVAVFSPWGMQAVARIGVKHAMLASTPFIIAYYILLLNIEQIGLWLLALPFLMAVHSVLYWPAFHIDFARFSDKKQRGRQTSYAVVIISLASSVAPLVGGVVIATMGFTPLFIMALALFFASIIPLFLSKDIQEHYHDHYETPFEEVAAPKYRRSVIAFAGEGSELLLYRIVWPLFLFLLAINFEMLGLITSAALVVGMVVAVYVGRITDVRGPERMLKWGAIATAVLWPLRLLVRTPLDAFLVHLSNEFTRSMAYIPFGALFYNWVGGAGFNRDRFVLIRAISLNGAGGMLLVAIGVASLFTDQIQYAFLLGSVFSLALLFMLHAPARLRHNGG